MGLRVQKCGSEGFGSMIRVGFQRFRGKEFGDLGFRLGVASICKQMGGAFTNGAMYTPCTLIPSC